MAPVGQLDSRAIIVHPLHYASQQQKEAHFAAARRRRSRRTRSGVRSQDLPPEAWQVVAEHVQSGVELGRLCMVSRAANHAIAQEHWKQLCVRVWSVDAGQWSSVAGKRTPCDMTAQRRCECASCQAQSAGAKLKRCARCKEVFYCSVQCQRRSWTTHRACCSRAGLSKAPSCWRQLYRYNHDLLRNTFLDPALDHTLQQAYPRVSNFSMAA